MAEGRKIYIEVKERNPFGEDFDEDLIRTPDRSSNFIEGYSDKRHENELLAKEGHPINILPHRLQFVKAKNHVSGTDSGVGVQKFRDLGYVPADWDDCVKLGYRVDKNENFVKTPDGRVQWGDTILMIADKKVAATQWKAQRDAIEAQGEAVEARMENAVESFNRSDAARKGKARAQHFSFVGDDPEEK